MESLFNMRHTHPIQPESDRRVAGILPDGRRIRAKMIHVKWCWVAAFVLGFSSITPAMAERSGMAIEAPDVRNFVGLAPGIVPDYPGSDNYTVGIAPTARLQLGKSERYIRLLANELSLNLWNSSSWSAGPVLLYRFGRDDVDDSVVKLMRDIDNNFEVGVFAGWTWAGKPDPRHRFNVSVQVLRDVSNEHNGYLINASARYWRPVSRPVTLSLGIATTYGSGN